MLFISPPFGNYVSTSSTTSIRGSFTLEPRPGLLWQILTTLRYSFAHGGWVNQIGLRNPGLDYAIKNYNNKSIVSIAVLKEDQIDEILHKIPKDMNIELNVSCPNIGPRVECMNLSKFVTDQRKWCIIKLSPYTNIHIIDDYYDQGFRQFHCCNTIPVSAGGLSGSSLVPFTTKNIKLIKEKYPDTTVIAGGGIRTLEDVNHYQSHGADHFSISSLFFNPFALLAFTYQLQRVK